MLVADRPEAFSPHSVKAAEEPWQKALPMTVDAVVYFRVIDPAAAVVRVEKYLKATSLISQTTLRSVLGQAELDELLSQRDKINLRLQEIIDRQTDSWGSQSDCRGEKSDGRRFVDGAFLFFEMLNGVQQFTGAGITLEGQRLEDGADTILNPDRFRLQNPIIVILA